MEESTFATAKDLIKFLEQYPERRRVIFSALVDYYQISRIGLAILAWRKANPAMSDDNFAKEILELVEKYGEQWFLETNHLNHEPKNLHTHTISSMERAKRAKELGQKWVEQAKMEMKKMPS